MIKSGLPFLVSEKSRNMYRVERFKLKIIPSRWDGYYNQVTSAMPAAGLQNRRFWKCAEGKCLVWSQAQGFLVDKVVEGCRWNSLCTINLPSNTFGSPSSEFCMVFRCWFISGLFPFPIIHFGLWPDNLSRGLVKPCRWVWKAGCKGSFDVFCSYHFIENILKAQNH